MAVDWYQTDYSQTGIEDTCRRLGSVLDQQNAVLQRVVICNGMLHGEGFKPEKRIESVEPGALMAAYETNAVIPMLWLRALLPFLNHGSDAVIAALSARVGSIEDNNLGGWYSYRASKAALNMLLKTASVEYGRRAPRTSLIAFHPGTTRSPLSEPFLGNVAEERIFSPEFVAGQLWDVLERARGGEKPAFVDWAGKDIPW